MADEQVDDLRPRLILGWVAYISPDGLPYIAICEEKEEAAWITLADCVKVPESLEEGYDAAIAQMKAAGWTLRPTQMSVPKLMELPETAPNPNRWLDFNDVKPLDDGTPSYEFGEDEPTSNTRH